ncbi:MULTISPECIES: triose-phosphate isomerase [Hyphobacterium]|uniref:Triosephosphate isomerase n=1 Tax=Hyphobacterium vulgare TaxID=1736751 RepID=A0ABV6ZT03_9PROT
MPRTPLIAGNWKMHGLKDALGYFDALAAAGVVADGREILVCPPATLVAAAAARAAIHGIAIGGQDCHTGTSGAHTGDISAAMLRDAGANYVIVGHSERRGDHGETDALVCAKARAARAAGLTPIICVGETLSEREAGQENGIVAGQLTGSIPGVFGPADFVVAYEPVWAIGTGRTASSDDIAAMHAFIRSSVPDGEQVRILYGGSVKPENAAAILALSDVDGALVGGASLDPASFADIAKSV